ncbi:hypothetical protein [Planktothrix sp. FACHB-1365]|uniref:hypothetical protein n=1 Tax=Planktothrix sp. FACHB-1365 TaxID=2692855 RepID=UPI0016864CDC|nr:hypothetical protein [Planktothrix sp. FACHB-1365]MBD2481473.1 hypothetical protein [Planktothrix sp. FACHB-1365]
MPIVFKNIQFKEDESEDHIGAGIYILGLRGSMIHKGYAGIFDRNKIRTFIIEFAKEILNDPNESLNESLADYEYLWAFHINDDREIALMFDLIDIDNPIEIFDKTIQKTIWDSVKPSEEPF